LPGIKLRPKRLEDWFFLFETEFLPFFIIARIFLIDGILNPEQAVSVLYALNCRLSIIKLFAFRNHVNKVSVDMSPTRVAFDTGNLIIALVSIRFQVTLKIG